MKERVSDSDLLAMLRIRAFEQRLLDLFAANKVSGTTHTCLGQEYVPVALSPLVTDADFAFSHHRGHGHYLARFADARSLLAEILGREGAVCAGVGGSQHIRRGRYLSTGVQGESLPAAAGVALHLKTRGERNLAIAFVGDGTWGEGAVYEALNVASLWSLPLLVVVEHNGIAQTTRTEQAMAGTIQKRCEAFGVRHLAFGTDELSAIRAALAGPVEAVRAGSGPLVVEFATHRIGPHSKGDDTRSADELALVLDWLADYRRAHDAHVRAVEDAVSLELSPIFEDVLRAPLSVWEPG